ncbi:phosphate ABC transporter permease subunit PstC [Pelagibius sp. Alg239-R121]|uniref:phosphate ABC transporter permease subunit PstC n=1 Tax=Pelagibius sp. Alg239-R121 TaxID=2993448 RepID=UPI0024A72A7E|nr:phosphate ABC transporter permease subunit PstC [Pelagibius sp. Alg239-R121]
MSLLILATTLFLLSVAGFYLGRGRAFAVSGGQLRDLHSRPQYYGMYVALWCGLPSLVLLCLWLALEPEITELILVANLPASAQGMSQDQLALFINQIKNLANGNAFGAVSAEIESAAKDYASLRDTGFAAMTVIVLALGICGLAFGRRSITPAMRARNQVEKVVSVVMMVASTIAIVTTVGIVLSLLFEALRFFTKVPPMDFLFGLQWSPQTALREDQVGGSGAFGAIPLFAGTLLITFIAMCVAVPVGLFSAIYMSEYAGPKMRAIVKPVLEVLAGIPTVVYGFFAALTMAPFFRQVGEFLNLDVSSESALVAGIVIGVMSIPFVSSLSDDVMNSVPQTLRDGAYALGATKSETIKQVVVPAALPGIVGSVLLAISRAIGETMIVVMAAGLAANLTANPLEAVTTVTVQIVTLLVGDQEFDSAKTLAAFALGLVLFLVTLALNVVALRVVRKYREKYD